MSEFYIEFCADVEDYNEEFYKVRYLVPTLKKEFAGDSIYVNLSFSVFEEASKALMELKDVYISKNYEGEAQIGDLRIEITNPLEYEKRKALLYMNNALNIMTLKLSIFDVLEFFFTLTELRNEGFDITLDNKDDKYMEIIEKYQNDEDPGEENENFTYEESVEYQEKKKRFEKNKRLIDLLQKHISSLEKMTQLFNLYEAIKGKMEKIEEAETVEDLKDF